MPIELKPMRYAHSDGHTDVHYSEDGQKLITCGSDGDIRIWSGFDDDDPTQTCIGEWSLCVRQKNNYLHVATSNNDIQLMTYPEAERCGILVRFTAPVNHIAMGKKHDLIALACEAMEVKIMDVSDPTERKHVKSFNDFKGPPLSVALSPEAKHLAVSCGDGQLRVWDIENSTLVKEIDCVPKINSFMNAKLLCRMDFEPASGATLAYPTNNTIVIVNTLNWTDKTILTCPEIESPYSIVQFSPCGKFIAATSQTNLVVWDVYSKQIIDVAKHPRSISLCAMTWNPSGNGEIAFCDTEGQLGLAINCKLGEALIESNIVADEDNQVDLSGFQFDDDDDDEDNENAVSLEKLKNEIMGKEEPELNFDKASSSGSTTPRPRTPEILMQRAFMPSSTPEHLNPRYLCWNDIGIVRCYGGYAEEEEDTNKSIEVEFHDVTFHNSIMIKNFQSFTMGSLSKSALAVANSNLITTIPLDAGAKEWSLSLAEDEEIVCIACSEYLVCYATADYLIRVCSLYGTQKVVFSVPGPVVSLAAHDYFLLVAYHSGAPRKGDQCISMMLVKLEGLSIESKDIKSALRPENTLQWLGFTDQGTPVIQDSLGLLYLYPLTANVWLPFCDTTKHRSNPSDGFFVTSVLESLQTLRGIRCRGSIYPGFTPRPTLSELPLEPSFSELSTEKSQLEANLFTWSNLRVENVEKRIKETALKAFALACKNNLDQRALELIEMISNPQLVTLATKYASKLNKRRLADKLMQIASTMQDYELDESSLSQNIASTPPTNILKPINRKIILSSAIKRTQKRNIENEGIQEESAPTELDQPPSDSSLMNETNLTDTSINTQESVFNKDSPANPFLKHLKKGNTSNYNPLSLTDKFAGFNAEEESKKKKKTKESDETENNERSVEKRKKPDSDMEKQKEKQRRLDKFMFTKKPKE